MFTCTLCKQEFDFPAFGPCPKQLGNHTVESKTYVHGGSANIQNVRDRRHFSPTVFLVADKQAISAGGEIIHSEPLVVHFSDARYSTGNPEEQWHLETQAAKKFPIFWGEQGEKVWRENQLTVEQQTSIARTELADMQRKIKESNDLLSMTRASKQPKPVTA